METSLDPVAAAAKKLGYAIAVAEGFFVDGSLPERCHNPGDLELGDKGYGVNGGKTIFGSDSDGWAALYRECALMLSGASHVYSPSWTLEQVASHYTGGDNPDGWATTVLGKLQCPPGTTLMQLVRREVTPAPEAA